VVQEPADPYENRTDNYLLYYRTGAVGDPESEVVDVELAIDRQQVAGLEAVDIRLLFWRLQLPVFVSDVFLHFVFNQVGTKRDLPAARRLLVLLYLYHCLVGPHLLGVCVAGRLANVGSILGFRYPLLLEPPRTICRAQLLQLFD